MIPCEWGYEGCSGVGETLHRGDPICWSCKRTGEAEYEDWLSCARG